MPTPGVLYFLREASAPADQASAELPYVKIGVVRADKLVRKRMDELQTGNPRTIESVPQFVVEADRAAGPRNDGVHCADIAALEAAMHGMFALRRVRGEWFYLPTADTVREAIDAGTRLAQEMGASEGAAIAAEQFAGLPSTAPERAPTRGEEDLARELAAAMEAARLVRARRESIGLRLRLAVGEAAEIPGVAVWQAAATPKFDEPRFSAAFPDLVDQYRVEKALLRGLFKLTQGLRSSSLDADRASEMRELKEAVAAISGANRIGRRDRTREATTLRAAYLAALAEEAPLVWRSDRLEEQLKARIAEAAGLSGVCSWTRRWSIFERFDPKALRADRPELVDEFSQPRVIARFRILEERSYPMGEWG